MSLSVSMGVSLFLLNYLAMYQTMKHVLLSAMGLGTLGLTTLGVTMGMMTSCQQPEVKTSITVDLQAVNQTMDGFGVAEADWADDVFVFPKREQVLDALFSESGLNANILRGEIFPHYSNNPKHLDFALDTDTTMNTVKAAATLERNDLLRRGQYWLTSRVQQKYDDVLFTFSVWSPPAWMKEGGHATEMYPASGGKLMKKHYQSFADYLVSFYKAFDSIGVQTYAVSPSNEPGFAAPWNSCQWSFDEMGDFIHNYLLPTFKKENVPAKVLFGENPAWSTVFDKLKMISSADFCNDLLKKYPLDSERVIAAGHGYVLPDTLPLPADLRRTPILPFEQPKLRGIHSWVTEISDITPLDVSMEDGLYWAEMFQQYLMDAHVNAIVWWCGAMPTKTNESLVILNNETGDFVLSKRYDAFGNYTRYIAKGSQCVDNQTTGFPGGVVASSFKKDNQFTIVVVNRLGVEFPCKLALKDSAMGEVVKSYTTTAETRWQEAELKASNGECIVNVPPMSVVTYTGTVK